MITITKRILKRIIIITITIIVITLLKLHTSY